MGIKCKEIMKFTKRQRNALYKETLKRFLTMSRQQRSSFICTNLARMVERKYNFYPDQYQIEDLFSELVKFKPKKFPTEGGMWWVASNEKRRIDVLKSCIRQTIPKPKKKS